MDISPNTQAIQAIGWSRRIGAHNVASMNTPAFKASRLTLETGPHGHGVRPQSIDPDLARGSLLPALRGEDDEGGVLASDWGLVRGSKTELVAEMVDSIQDQRAFEANVVMVRAWDELTGTILDLRA